MSYVMIKQQDFGCAGCGGCSSCVGGLGGLGAWSPATAKRVLAQANRNIARAIPRPVISMIDASPLSRAQKSWLKREPLSFLIIIGDWAHDLCIEFVKRTQARSRKGEIYNMGGRRVVVRPRKSDNPSRLMAQVLTVSFHNPVEAAIVLAQLHIEVASGAFTMVGAGAQQAGKDLVSSVAKTAQDTSRAVQSAVDAGVKSGQQAFNTVTSWFSGFGLVDGGVVTVPAATGVAAASGGAAAATGTVTAESLLFSAISALIALAPVVVPALIDMAAEKTPASPTPAQVGAASAAIGPAREAEKKLSTGGASMSNKLPGGQASAATANTVFGLPPTVVYAGAAAAGLGGLMLILRR